MAVAPATELEQRVRGALSEVLDPCSVGRGVPAGLVDMGMVCGVDVIEHGAAPADVHVELRLTSPGCTFQLYFERELRERIEAWNDVGRLELSWSRRFDWDDDDMSPDLKRRLRLKREAVLRRPRAEVEAEARRRLAHS